MWRGEPRLQAIHGGCVKTMPLPSHIRLAIFSSMSLTLGWSFLGPLPVALRCLVTNLGGGGRTPKNSVFYTPFSLLIRGCDERVAACTKGRKIGRRRMSCIVLPRQVCPHPATRRNPQADGPGCLGKARRWEVYWLLHSGAKLKPLHA